MTEEALFAVRTNRTGEPMSELRVNLPIVLLGVLDSMAISETRATGRFVSRTDIVAEILSEYINRKIDEAHLITQSINAQSNSAGS